MSLREEVTTHPRYARDVLATSHFLALLLHDRVVERLEAAGVQIQDRTRHPLDAALNKVAYSKDSPGFQAIVEILGEMSERLGGQARRPLEEDA